MSRSETEKTKNAPKRGRRKVVKMEILGGIIGGLIVAVLMFTPAVAMLIEMKGDRK
jgi:hypothetical protein